MGWWNGIIHHEIEPVKLSILWAWLLLMCRKTLIKQYDLWWVVCNDRGTALPWSLLSTRVFWAHTGYRASMFIYHDDMEMEVNFLLTSRTDVEVLIWS